MMAILSPPHTPPTLSRASVSRFVLTHLPGKPIPRGLLCPEEVFPHLLTVPPTIPPAHQGQFVSEVTENTMSLIWSDWTFHMVF